MSFFSRLKGLFSRKKTEVTQEGQQAQQESIEEEIPDVAEEEQKEAKPQTGMRPDVERKEKICPDCGAPNDVFVNVCWLCKKKIY